jgi:hypothetical protein
MGHPPPLAPIIKGVDTQAHPSKPLRRFHFFLLCWKVTYGLYPQFLFHLNKKFELLQCPRTNPCRRRKSFKLNSSFSKFGEDSF